MEGNGEMTEEEAIPPEALKQKKNKKHKFRKVHTIFEEKKTHEQFKKK